MAQHNSTRYLCNECEIGVMTPDVTPGGESVYQCRFCNHTAMARLVETDNAPLPDGYGSRIRALIDMAMCDADIAARAILETHRVKEAA